jgi:hypothetical protein
LKENIIGHLIQPVLALKIIVVIVLKLMNHSTTKQQKTIDNLLKAISIRKIIDN